MVLITDKHIEIYQTTITDVRRSLGRWATIYLEPTKSDCLWCILDPVNGKSSGVAEPDKDWETHPNYISPYNIKVCPECNESNYIEDNREKKESDSKYSKIPDFACSNYGDNNGCGKGWYIGNEDFPTGWI